MQGSLGAIMDRINIPRTMAREQQETIAARVYVARNGKGRVIACR